MYFSNYFNISEEWKIDDKKNPGHKHKGFMSGMVETSAVFEEKGSSNGG